MAYTIGDKTYRNLQEQVLQNARDINDIKTVNTLLNQFGIKVVGECDTALDLPDPSTYSGNYGDAYAVGTETPYDLYIFTRPFDGEDYPHWFNIGPFPLEGPEGPQGETGAQGEKGNTGGAFLTGEGNPPTSIGTQDGQGYLDATTGNIYQYSTNPASWTRVGSISGPEGPQGPIGPQGPTGPQGTQGPQGPQGPAGKVVNIVGNLASIENLPTPSTVDFHNAYLVGSSVPYHLYIIEGTESDSTTWSWFDAGAFTSGGEYTRVTDDNDSYVANLEATTTPESGAVARYDSDGQLQCEAPTVDKDVANKKYVDDNKGAKVLVLTGNDYRVDSIISEIAYENGAYDFSKVYQYIYFSSANSFTFIPDNYVTSCFIVSSSSSGSRYADGLFVLVGGTRNGILKYEQRNGSEYLTPPVRQQNIRTICNKITTFSLDCSTGRISRFNNNQAYEIVSFQLDQALQATKQNIPYTNITIDGTTKTATLSVDSNKWTNLTSTTREIYAVNIRLSSLQELHLQRVAMNDNSTPKTCDYACIVDKTIYWAHFENNSGVYSGLLKQIDPVEGNVADTPSALLTTLKTQDGTVYGINNAKKYNVIKFNIPDCPDYQNASLYFLMSDHMMNDIYLTLSTLAGVTVDSSNINTIVASILSGANTVLALQGFFDSLVLNSEKIYFGKTDSSLNAYQVTRILSIEFSESSGELHCLLFAPNNGSFNIYPQAGPDETLTGWQRIAITLENYKADNSDEIYDQETA